MTYQFTMAENKMKRKSVDMLKSQSRNIYFPSKRTRRNKQSFVEEKLCLEAFDSVTLNFWEVTGDCKTLIDGLVVRLRCSRRKRATSSKATRVCSGNCTSKTEAENDAFNFRHNPESDAAKKKLDLFNCF